MSERQEGSQQESREKEETSKKFDWADNVYIDTSVTPICTVHNEPILIANNNMPVSASTHPITSVDHVGVTLTAHDLSALCSDTMNPCVSVTTHENPTNPYIRNVTH
jgi:hypothetical protein